MSYYKQYRNKLSRLLHISEQQHYDDLLKENKHIFSWRIMKDIISKNKTSSSCSRFYINDDVTITSNKKVIAENSIHFSSMLDRIWQKKPPNSQSPTGFMIRNINSMAVLPVSQSEVSDIINNLKNSSPGWDSISANVVKATYPHFIEPLMHIMNLSITQGIFPKQMKLAKVIPLFKSGDPMTFPIIGLCPNCNYFPRYLRIWCTQDYHHLSTNTDYYTLISLDFVGGILLISLWFA